MFIQTLKLLDLPYHVFSAANNTDFKNLNWNSLRNLQTFQKVSQDSNVKDLHRFNIGKWAEDNQIETTNTKHLYEDGHKMFANHLMKNVIDDLIC